MERPRNPTPGEDMFATPGDVVGALGVTHQQLTHVKDGLLRLQVHPFDKPDIYSAPYLRAAAAVVPQPDPEHPHRYQETKRLLDTFAPTPLAHRIIASQEIDFSHRLDQLAGEHRVLTGVRLSKLLEVSGMTASRWVNSGKIPLTQPSKDLPNYQPHGKYVSAETIDSITSWEYPDGYEPNKYTVLSSTAIGELGRAFPALPRSVDSAQQNSVRRVHMGDGAATFIVNHQFPAEELETQWRGHHSIDSLALRTVTTAPIADNILVNRDPDIPSGSDLSAPRIKRLQKVHDGLGLPGLVAKAFREGVFVPDKLDTTVTTGQSDPRTLDVLRLAANGANRDVTALYMGTTPGVINDVRSKLFADLEVHSAQEAVARAFLVDPPIIE